MHLFLLLILVIVVLVVLLVRDSYRDHRASQRNLQLREVAEQLGFELTEEQPQVQPLLAGSPLSSRAAEANLLLQGRRDDCEHQVNIFDLEDTTVIGLLADDEAAFPRFFMQPHVGAASIAKITGDAALAGRFETIADVGGRSALFGQDFQLDVHEEDLGRLRAKLTGRPRELLAARREARLFVTSTGDRFFTYVVGEKIPGPNVEQRLLEVIELASLLSASAREVA